MQYFWNIALNILLDYIKRTYHVGWPTVSVKNYFSYNNDVSLNLNLTHTLTHQTPNI